MRDMCKYIHGVSCTGNVMYVYFSKPRGSYVYIFLSLGALVRLFF